MDYRLATAMRGPDHNDLNKDAWKIFVTASLRWLAAKIQKKNPEKWSKGSVWSPEEFYRNIQDENFVGKALKFARTTKSEHVKSHARDAFEYLRETSQREDAEKIERLLVEKGLL